MKWGLVNLSPKQKSYDLFPEEDFHFKTNYTVKINQQVLRGI